MCIRDSITAGHGFLERGPIAQVSNRPLRFQSLDVLAVARRADQETQFGALLGQNPGDVATHESGGAGDKSFQVGSQFSVLSFHGRTENWEPWTELLQRLRLERNIGLSGRLAFPVIPHPGFPILSCGHIASAKGQACDVQIGNTDLPATIFRQQTHVGIGQRAARSPVKDLSLIHI